jgi:hypothetical protein
MPEDNTNEKLIAQILEDGPLYIKYDYKAPRRIIDVPRPAIYKICETCKRNQTFVIHDFFYPGLNIDHQAKFEPSNDNILFLRYVCVSCHNFYSNCLLKFGNDSPTVMKVGQYPSQLPELDDDLEKMLGKVNSGYYKKATICEIQGYGIAAYAYYRRIVELILNDLLESIKDVCEDSEKEAYINSLIRSKGFVPAEKKIEVVKDYLPTSLKVNGNNLFNSLYQSLSAGLHSETDEQCIGIATDIRNVLTLLIQQIKLQKQMSPLLKQSLKNIDEHRLNGK